MQKRSLVLYASRTGNTEKVALRFKGVIERRGWGCDLLKVDKKTGVKKPLFDYEKYDLFCVGSGVDKSLPSAQLVDVIRNNPYCAHYNEHLAPPGSPPAPKPHGRIQLGPDSKKGIVFVTYAGDHFGPKEAEPSLSLLESELEHLQVQCIGKFACPGRMGRIPITEMSEEMLGTLE